MKYYIGIDLGGTSVRVGKVGEDASIVQEVKRPSYGNQGPKKINENIIAILKEFDLSDVSGIGLAIPGPVDQKTNTITMATNIKGSEGYPFARNIEKEFHIPVFLDNDANAAGLAESIFGSGKGYPNVFYITHSTGIGGGLIINNKIAAGHKGYGAEIAAIIVDPKAKNDPYYAHLPNGAVEALASGKALEIRGKKKIDKAITCGKDVFDLAKKGNEKAFVLIDEMAKDVALALSAISATVAPDVFVIGGGVAKQSAMYFPKLKKYYQQFTCKGLHDVKIVKAKLKEPGLLGAAMIAKSRLEK